MNREGSGYWNLSTGYWNLSTYKNKEIIFNRLLNIYLILPTKGIE
jgi:hypothetical protein